MSVQASLPIHLDALRAYRTKRPAAFRPAGRNFYHARKTLKRFHAFFYIQVLSDIRNEMPLQTGQGLNYNGLSPYPSIGMMVFSSSIFFG